MRRICLFVAIGSGLCAGLLLLASPSVTVDGHEVACGSILVNSESGSVGHPSACAPKAHALWALVGLAGLACAVSGSYVKVGGRDERAI